MRSVFLWLTLTLFAGCGFIDGGPQPEILDVPYDDETELAVDVAAADPDVDEPVEVGFESDLLQRGTSSGATGVADAPRWFCPRSAVTRAQMASFLVRTMHPAESIPAPVGRFSDVPVSHTHARAIEQLARDGITVGCGGDRFCPERSVTRDQMATFLVRMLDLQTKPFEGTFRDVDEDNVHARSIEALARAGITQGCGSGVFCPADAVTREQMATFLIRALHPTNPPAPKAIDTFADVAPDNVHLQNIERLADKRITLGCGQPPVTFRVNGNTLSSRQQEWVLYLAAHAVPRLTKAYGSESRAREVAARTVWWSLKEGVFGSFEDPFRYSNCNTASGDRRIGPFETCSPTRAWQVGLAGVQVRNSTDAEVDAAAKKLYPDASPDQVATDIVEFGRALTAASGQSAYPSNAVSQVLGNAHLRRSWLLRDGAIGTYRIIGDIERECVNSTRSWCFGTGWDATKKFAPNRSGAERSQRDLRTIFNALAPR